MIGTNDEDGRIILFEYGRIEIEGSYACPKPQVPSVTYDLCKPIELPPSLSQLVSAKMHPEDVIEDVVATWLTWGGLQHKSPSEHDGAGKVFVHLKSIFPLGKYPLFEGMSERYSPQRCPRPEQ